MSLQRKMRKKCSQESTQGATAPKQESYRRCAMRILRCVRRHIGASSMCRQPIRAACGRTSSDWEGRSAAWENREAEGRKSKVEGRRSGETRFVASAVARTKPGPPFQRFPVCRRRFPIWCGAPVSQLRRSSVLDGLRCGIVNMVFYGCVCENFPALREKLMQIFP